MQQRKSFASQVKNEVYCNKQYRIRHKLAQGYGLIMFSKHFRQNEISLVTENRGVAHLYSSFLYELLPIKGTITMQETLHRDGSRVYTVAVDSEEDRLQILEAFVPTVETDSRIRLDLLCKEGDIEAFLSGVYLACGNMTDPLKGYHMEFVISQKEHCSSLTHMLEELGVHFGTSQRRGQTILYIKEGEQIQDILTMIGASKSAFELIDAMIYKDLRNKVNRQTNCETANIDKTVRAASEQIATIKALIQHGKLETLPDDMKELALLRMENPEMSLRELGESHSQNLSRSAVNNRFQKMIRQAEEL